MEDATAAQAYGKTVAMGYITSTDKCYARNGGDYMAQLIGMGRRHVHPGRYGAGEERQYQYDL